MPERHGRPGDEAAGFRCPAAERTLYRRAVEAAIWGMPAVNYERMLQAAIANGAKPNQVVYWYRPVNWKNQTLTPNPDTIYSTVFVDAYDKPFDATIPYDATFFELLNRFIQAEPWLTRDKAMIDPLKSIGIEKGKPFNPDAKTKRILANAAREAQKVIALKYESGFMPPFLAGTRWSVPVPPETRDGLGSGFAEPNEYGIDGRAVMYHMAYFSPKVFGGGQFYLMNVSDRAGRPLEGSKTYRLRVPANAPVEQYWSATAYDRETHTLIRGVSRPSLASNDSAVQKNADGSVDVYFGATAPAGKQSNWVPTDPSGGSNCCSDSTAPGRNSSG